MLIGVNQKITRNNTNISQQKTAFDTTSNKPIAESQRITNLPSTYYNHPNISFAGKYDPSRKEIAKIQTALQGWKFSTAKGPDYFPHPKVTQALCDLMQSEKPLAKEQMVQLAQNKAAVSNNFVLTKLEGKIRTPESFAQETAQFVEELKTETKSLKKTFKALGLSKDEIKVFDKFTSHTAPILFSMGFADAISHSSQVAKKCAIEARSKTSNTTEILKSAMVGWLHDPKLPGNVAFSNLAAHPVIAGTIADKVLNSKEMQIDLMRLLSSQTKSKEFAKGVSESLAINNDSEWVMNNVILHRNKFVPNAQDGLADFAPEIEPIIKQRFSAPSKGEIPAEIPQATLKKLADVKFETGIRGVDRDSFQKACSELSADFEESKGKTPSEIHNGILKGEINSPEFIAALKGKLNADPNAIKNCTVPGSTLLCHHLETSAAGKLPAQTLIVSDPMLLSPHKIILGGFEPTSTNRITSFIKSFNDNVNALPKENQPKGRVWQKELLTSMMDAADELSQKPKADYTDLNINEMTEKLSDSKTWGKYGGLDTKVPENTPKLVEMAAVIKKHYDNAAETSKNMFRID